MPERGKSSVSIFDLLFLALLHFRTKANSEEKNVFRGRDKNQWVLDTPVHSHYRAHCLLTALDATFDTRLLRSQPANAKIGLKID